MAGFFSLFMAHSQQTLLVHYPLVALTSLFLALILRKLEKAALLTRMRSFLGL